MSDWIERLLDQSDLPARSLRQYRIGLRYWETWHRLRYATPLPLSLAAPQAVQPTIVDDFVADHTPISLDGRIRMRMVDELDRGLRETGYNRDIDCVTPRTTYWRIEVLNSAHRLADLPVDRRAAFKHKQELNAIWGAERAAIGTPTAVPMSAATIVERMLQACGSDWDGARDAALIVLAQYLTVGQICQIELGEWRLGERSIHGQVVPVMELDIREPVGDIQTFARGLCMLGDDAELVRAWWAIRYGDGALASEPFLVRAARKKEPGPLSDKWVFLRFRTLAQRAGITGAKGRSPFSPNAIRKAFEHEFWEHSGLALTARRLGMSTPMVLR